MYLKEFDLDLRYIPNLKSIARVMEIQQCEYREATKLGYQENWKDKRRAFRLQTRCITSMFEKTAWFTYRKDQTGLEVACYKSTVCLIAESYRNLAQIIDNSG